MAARKPLVLDAALKIQELQAGDFIDVGGSEITATFTSITIAGAPVYADGNDTVDLAQASSAGTSQAVGLASTAVAAAAAGEYIHQGPVSLTTGEWDAVAGTTGGLTVDNCYFLSDATAGVILEEGSTSGLAAGDSVVLLGYAISTLTLLLNIEKPILRG